MHSINLTPTLDLKLCCISNIELITEYYRINYRREVIWFYKWISKTFVIFFFKEEWGDTVRESRIVQPASLSLNKTTQLLAVYGNSYYFERKELQSPYFWFVFVAVYLNEVRSKAVTAPSKASPPLSPLVYQSPFYFRCLRGVVIWSCVLCFVIGVRYS